MIKNVILDVGGIFFDDSKQNIEKLLNKNSDNIYKFAYGKDFKKCLLGEITVEEHINNLKGEKEFNDISYILKKENLVDSYPLMKTNFEYIKKLKNKGYKLFLLTNITEDSYNYINDLININKVFAGGIYSYQEGVVKPNHDIYNLLINRFNLNKDETVFFDDKVKNVLAAKEVGIKSYVFNSIEDIENVLYKNKNSSNVSC